MFIFKPFFKNKELNIQKAEKERRDELERERENNRHVQERMRIEAETQERQIYAKSELERATAEKIRASGEANARAIEENGKI